MGRILFLTWLVNNLSRMKTNTKLIIACIFTMVMILHFNVQAQQAHWKYQTYENPLALFPKKAFGYWDYEQNKNVFQANIEAYIAEYKKRDLPLSGIVIRITSYNVCYTKLLRTWIKILDGSN